MTRSSPEAPVNVFFSWGGGVARAVARSRLRWELAAAAFYAAASLLFYALDAGAHVPASDGFYSWIYARSLAYDGDIDFSNDYGLCGDPFRMGLTHANRPGNIYYIGPAVFWAPIIWVLKHAVSSTDARIAGACTGPIPTIVLGMSSLAGAGVVLLTSAILRRYADSRVSALAALIACIGGPLIYLGALSPSYSHAYDALSIVAFLYVVVRIRERGHRGWWIVFAGLLLGLSILQRASNAIFFVVAVAGLLRIRPARELWASLWTLVWIGAVATASGFAPLLLANHYLYGRFTLITHGPHFLHFTHAHPWLLIFDQRGGLLEFSPFLWLAVPGFALLLRRRETYWLVIPITFVGLVEIYVSSAAIDWQGARRISNLTPLAALGIAMALGSVARWFAARPARIAPCAGLALAVAVAYPSLAVCYGFAHGKLPFDEPIQSADLFGEAEKQLARAAEARLGSIGAVPAAWIFALRYGLPPSSFGLAVHPTWYARDFRSLEYTRSDISFTGTATTLLRGLATDAAHPSGACLTGLKGAAVFAAQWPFATRARLVYDTDRTATIRVTRRSPWGKASEWRPESRLNPGTAKSVYLRIGPEGFDSGVNEIEFERESADGFLCLRRLEFLDDAKYPATPYSDASPPVHVLGSDPYRDGAAAPSIAVGPGPSGQWMAEVHAAVAPGRDSFYVGPLADFSVLVPHGPRGFDARVAASPEGDLVEAYRASENGPVRFRMGRFGGTDNAPKLVWFESSEHGAGAGTSLAAAAGQIVEVHVEANGVLVASTAHYTDDGAIDWAPGMPIGGEPGDNVAIAIARSSDGEARVVEVNDAVAAGGFLFVRTATLSHSGILVWGRPVQYEGGRHPAVAVYGRTVVEVHQGQDGVGSLWVKSGRLNDNGTVTWRSAREYDKGLHPALAVDPQSGTAIEVHQAADGFEALWYREFAVY